MSSRDSRVAPSQSSVFESVKVTVYALCYCTPFGATRRPLLRAAITLTWRNVTRSGLHHNVGLISCRYVIHIRLECRLGVLVHCLWSNGVIIHMTSGTLDNAATSWITYHSTIPAGSSGGALVGGLGDEVPQLKVVTSKFYAFLVVIHTQYMKLKHWFFKTKTTKHNSNPQIVRQYELLSSCIWKNE